jgi:hypothetical protein
MPENAENNNGEQQPAPKRQGRRSGSKNKPKTDSAAGEASIENSPKKRAARFLEDQARAKFLEANKKNLEKLHNFATQRVAISQTQPLIDRINYGFGAGDEAGRNLMVIARDTGILLLEWKATVGHGNWEDVYASAGFNKSIDTARNWMRLSLLTDAEIAELSSVTEALSLLKDKKKPRKKQNPGAAPKPNPNPDPDPEPEPEPEPEMTPLDPVTVMKVVKLREEAGEDVNQLIADATGPAYLSWITQWGGYRSMAAHHILEPVLEDTLQGLWADGPDQAVKEVADTVKRVLSRLQAKDKGI